MNNSIHILKACWLDDDLIWSISKYLSSWNLIDYVKDLNWYRKKMASKTMMLQEKAKTHQTRKTNILTALVQALSSSDSSSSVFVVVIFIVVILINIPICLLLISLIQLHNSKHLFTLSIRNELLGKFAFHRKVIKIFIFLKNNGFIATQVDTLVIWAVR